jgi:hypothetical protein
MLIYLEYRLQISVIVASDVSEEDSNVDFYLWAQKMLPGGML